MIEGIHFHLSYSPTSYITAIHVILSITESSSKMNLYTIDITNSFQNNIITDVTKCHHLSLPVLYLKWYNKSFHNIK